MTTRVIVLAAAIALPGCFYPGDRGRALEVKVEKLADDNAQLAAQLKDTQAKLNDTVPKVDAKIAEVSKALDNLDRAARRSDADIGIQIQKAIEDVAGLRGQVETYLFKIGDLESALKKMTADTDARLTQIQGEEAVKAAEAKKKAEALKRPTDKKEFLAFAESKAKAGDQPLARELYTEFLKKWPKDEGVADAHYGIAESYLAEDQCRDALSEYGKIIQDFPKAKTAPAAYLHSSDCFKKLKMGSEARLALEELVKNYPKTDAAKTAKAKLAELDKAAKKPAGKKGSK